MRIDDPGKSNRARTDGRGLKLAVVCSEYNRTITDKLYQGAVSALEEHGVGAKDIISIWVPGSFELPLAAAEAAEAGFDAAVCLGVVIRGETAHFDFVAGQAAHGLARLVLDKRFPVGFGVITADTVDQALDRAGGGMGNKGVEAALAALAMVAVVNQIRRFGKEGTIGES